MNESSKKFRVCIVLPREDDRGERMAEKMENELNSRFNEGYLTEISTLPGGGFLILSNLPNLESPVRRTLPQAPLYNKAPTTAAAVESTDSTLEMLKNVFGEEDVVVANSVEEAVAFLRKRTAEKAGEAPAVEGATPNSMSAETNLWMIDIVRRSANRKNEDSSLTFICEQAEREAMGWDQERRATYLADIVGDINRHSKKHFVAGEPLDDCIHLKIMKALRKGIENAAKKGMS